MPDIGRIVSDAVNSVIPDVGQIVNDAMKGVFVGTLAQDAETVEFPEDVRRLTVKSISGGDLTLIHTPESRLRIDGRCKVTICGPEEVRLEGLKDDMTVIELWPGRGWYTEILASVMREKGKLRVTNFTAESELADMAKDYDALLASQPAIYGKVEVMRILPPNQLSLGPDESADMVLTFRNLHNWIMGGFEAKVFEATFKVLKHGGVFGFVEHHASDGTDPKLAKETGYVPEAYAVQLAQAAGFKLDSKSDVNANPKDPKNHEGGVWALPPNLKNGEKDKAKYQAIGESDRMTLKFAKP